MITKDNWNKFISEVESDVDSDRLIEEYDLTETTLCIAKYIAIEVGTDSTSSLIGARVIENWSNRVWSSSQLRHLVKHNVPLFFWGEIFEKLVTQRQITTDRQLSVLDVIRASYNEEEWASTVRSFSPRSRGSKKTLDTSETSNSQSERDELLERLDELLERLDELQSERDELQSERDELLERCEEAEVFVQETKQLFKGLFEYIQHHIRGVKG